MTYDVFGGTLSLAQSISQSDIWPHPVLVGFQKFESGTSLILLRIHVHIMYMTLTDVILPP